MKTKQRIILLVAFLFALSLVNCQRQKHIIDDNINLAVEVDIGDLDGDGRPDILVTDFLNYQINWYKNNLPSWEKYSIANENSTFALIADVDGNGKPDVVACLYRSHKMVWYENQLPDWNPHTIDGNTENADYTVAGDINGDGALDVVTAGSIGGGDLVWYENQHPNWIKHVVDSVADGIAAIKITDIDGDHLLDFACTLFEQDLVVWYKNEKYGQSWSRHIVDSVPDLPWGIGSGDINNDGLTDLVVTTGSGYLPGQGDRIFLLYTNTGESWKKEIIDPDMYSGLPDIRDMNGDGKMDIFTTTRSDIRWYEQNQTTWTKHVLDSNILKPGAYSFKDINGDNVDDLVLPTRNYIAWYENPYINTPVKLFKP